MRTRISSNRDDRAIVEALESRRLLSVDVGVGPGVHLIGESILVPGGDETYDFELLEGDDLTVQVDFSHAAGNLDVEVLDASMTVIGSGNSFTDNETVTVNGMTPGSYHVRVFAVGAATNTFDLSIDPAGTSSTRVLYVNDGDMTGDVYALAVGDDLNDGLTPLTPKATLQSLYDDHDIGPDDLVLIDTGTYAGGLHVEAADEAATIAGSPNNSNLTASTAINLEDADFNLIYGLRFINNSSGIYAHGDGVNDSTNNVYRNNYFDDVATGIRIDSGDTDLVEGNTFVNNASYGVRLLYGGSSMIVRDNVMSGQNNGIHATGQSTETLQVTVEDNTISAGTNGVYLASYTTGSIVQNNVITGQSTYGIFAAYEATISGNTVSGGSDIGIFTQNVNSTIFGNTVSGNTTGIHNYGGVVGGTDWSAGQPNDIFGNTTGILLGSGNNAATAQYNRIHGNTTGIETTNYSTIHHNILYRNTGRAIRLDGDRDTSITNNTIYSVGGDGVVLQSDSYDTTLTNNIIWSEAGTDIHVATDSQRGFVSDYNNLYTTTGTVVWWQKPFADLFDWQVEADYDTHSIGYTTPAPALDNPMFVNLAADDYHLQNAVSTSIDAGDPHYTYVNEPGPSGARINLGAYGDTPEAALSRPAYIQIEYPNYYTDWEATTPNVILWHAFNVAGDVDIEVHLVGGGLVDAISTVDVGDGSYSWSPASSFIAPNTADRYFIRITSVANPGATDDSREGFSVPIAGPSFYVDDTDVANINDEYTPGAHGDNRNTGKTISDPKANLLPMLRNYDLGPGDTVYIDTGDYIHVRNVILSGELGIGDDEGASFTGPTNLSKVAHIDRANPYAESTNIELYDADFVTMSNLTLTGAERGLWVHNGSTNFTGENLIVGSNSLDGIIVESDAEASHVNALTATDNGRYGIHISTQLATLSDSFAYDNGSYGMYLVNLRGALVSNNEVYNNGSYGINVSNGSSYDTTAIHDNLVYDNISRGISAGSNVLVSNNEVYGHNNINEHGIEIYSGAVARGNESYDNYNGIITNHTGQILGNDVHDNLNYGVLTFRSSRVIGNRIYGNAYGIRTDWWSSARFIGTVANNLIYDSDVTGLHIEGGGDGSRFWNNTVHETSADGIRIQDSSQDVNLRNNIIWVESDHGIYVANDSQTGFNSDYNLIYPTGTAVTGYWQSSTYATIQEWRGATFNDAHSQARDPQFVNVPGGDYHLQGTSPAIDGGDVQTYYLNEVLSGGRANQGAYGNTDQATSSPAELVQVLYPNGDERLEDGSDYLLQWRSFGLTLNDTIALVNAGGENSDNWLFDEYYTSGSTTSTSQPIDTIGVIDPAPMDVYQTYRQADSGIGGTLDYHLDVPDGVYDIRLHFAEYQYNSAGGRVFDIYAQGVLQVDDYDIWDDAGAQYKATTQSFAVVAAAGAGIDLQFVNETSARALLAAIEVTQATAGGVASPTVDLDLSTDSGATWNSINAGLTMDHYGRGEDLWTATPITPGITGLLRVNSNDASMPTDVSDGPFEIVTPVNIYYVNDATWDPGDWTSQPGSDANDGRTTATPMATISAVLATYDLEAGDIIRVDAGVYNLPNNIIVTADDEGVQIEGYNDVGFPGRQAILDRGNTAQNAFDIQSPNITLSYLWITGGRYGVNTTDADNLRVEHGKIYGNDRRGVYLDAATESATVTGVMFDGSALFQNYAVYVDGNLAIVSANEIFDHSSYGVYINNADQVTVIGNTIYNNNSYGVYATSTWGSEFSTNTVHDNASRGMAVYNTGTSFGQTLVSGNIVFANVSYGLEVAGDLLAISNQVYGHTNTNNYGISAGSGAEVRENTVFDNYRGIGTNHTATVIDNRVYNNSDIGIDARRGSSILGNQVYSNGIGILTFWWSSARFAGEVRNNVVYDNSVHGMQLGGLGLGSDIANNTVYQLVGDAVHVYSSSADTNIHSNILVVEGGRGVFVDNDSQTGFGSDYNLFYPTGTGVIGNWEGIDFTDRADWFYELGLEEHGKVGDPDWSNPAGPAGPDGILGYSGGVDHGLDDDFHVTTSSPALDAGDPLEYFFAEPKSGGRVNIGAYGGTSEAALSPDELVQVLAPNGLEKIELNQSYTISWRSFGLTLNDTLMLTNAGDGGTIDHWLYDRFYLNGTTTQTSQPIDTIGVINPAPMELYQTYRRAGNGIGTSLDYHLDIPDGVYTVRLHFSEYQYNSAGSRLFDIYAQGVLEVDDYDIWTDAGARYKATTESIMVTAVGGTGIDLSFVNETSAVAILSGIEITVPTSNGVASPTVELDRSTDNGGTWSLIAGGQPMDVYGRGSYSWQATPVTIGNTALIRARANDASMPTDESDEAFLIANDGPNYYVNDASTAGDVFTSAAGDNLFDGKTAATPMESLRALINAYDLNPGDLVRVDTGTYQVVRTIVVSTDDGGVTIQGPDTDIAVFDRANTIQNAFEIFGADVTLRYLDITGGEDGIYASAATGLTLENLDVYGNNDYGVHLDTGSGNTTVTNSTFYDNGFDGLYSLSSNVQSITFSDFYGNGRSGLYANASDQLTVTNNYSYDNSNRGLYITGSFGTLVEFNESYDNTSYGMEVGGVNNQSLTTVRDNTVYDNDGTYGLYVYTNVLAYNNESYGHVGTNHWGLYVNGAEASDNRVHSNENGILTATTGRVVANTVYNNTNIGILAYRSVEVLENHVYSNSIGVQVDWWSSARFTGRVQNNLIYANSNQGLLIEGGGTGIFANNTIYQEVGDAIRVQQSSMNVYLDSNILWVADGYAIWVDTDSEIGTYSDYNLIYLTGAGKLGSWQNIEFLDPQDWRYELGLDHNTRFGDPQFIETHGPDGQLGYVGGIDYGADDDFRVFTSSPAVDGGDPNSLYLREPDSGGRVNIGRYGNTRDAAASPAEVVHVLSPNGFEKLELNDNTLIEWIGWGLGSVNTIATMNTGAGRVGHWDGDRYYLNGTTTSFTSAVDTSGVTDPAPIEVYQTYRRSTSGVGNTLDYQLPVANGVYTLTLHFAEPSYNSAGSRFFDIFAEGLLEADDFDIYASAGARYKATTVSFSVAAVGGDGISLGFVNETSAQAIISAIEISAAAGGVASPTVDIDLSTDSGGTWSSIVTGVAMGSFGRGSYTWPASPLTPMNTTLVRVISNDGTLPQDDSDNPFLIANNDIHYYINDDSLAGDVLMTALGDDANDGKTAATPMATLWALLNHYQLEPGDIIHVDTGDYRVLRTIDITAADAGVVVQGESGATATFDRMYDRRNVFDITGAETSLGNLRITGGEDGVSIDEATGVNVSQSEIFGSRQYAIYVDSTSDSATLADNIIHDNGNSGIITAGSDNLQITGNESYANAGRGLYIQSTFGSLIDSNVVYDNTSYGVEVGGVSSQALTTVSNNTIYNNNSSYGLYVYTNLVASGNTVYGHIGSNRWGIYVASAEARQNNVFGNTNGILTSTVATVTGNRIFNNEEIGVFTYRDGQILGNYVYSNSIGIRTEWWSSSRFRGRVDNNLVYANTNQGILVEGGGVGSLFINNTVFQEVGDAIRMQDSSRDVTIRNNILWVESGYALYLDPNSQTGFDSNYNLFQIGTDPDAHLGYYNSTDYDALVLWQADTGVDADSLAAPALFVDPDGADDVLGYSTIGDGYDGGLDDNFKLSAGSPGIDRAQSFQASPTDIEGNPRLDDPGTPNLGGDYYVQNNLGANLYSAIGTAQTWRSNNTYWTYTLPFAFDFFGVTYTDVYVSTEGFLQFGSTSHAGDGSNTTAELISHTRIAALWDNLRTNDVGDDIFIDTTIPTEVTIRWDATNEADGTDVNFSITLLDNNEIQLHYGPGNTNLTPTVGISAGDGMQYLLASYDGLPVLTNANSIQFDLEAGIVDIGAYEFQGSSSDITPPTVTSTDPIAIHDEDLTNVLISQIIVNFSEALNPIDANALANYDLRTPGGNGSYGDGDDFIYTIVPSYVLGDTFVTIAIIGAPLPDGDYRLQVSPTDALRDTAGNPLDGDNDGFAGGVYKREFAVDLVAPSLVGVVINDGLVSRSWVDAIDMTFDEAMVVPNLTDLRLTGLATGVVDLTVIGAVLSYDGGTFTLSLDIPDRFALLNDNYILEGWSSALTDLATNPLDGVPNTFVTLSTFHKLAGDVTGDATVNQSDLGVLLAAYLQTPGDPFWDPNADLNGDGIINQSDLGILLANFNFSVGPIFYSDGDGDGNSVPDQILSLLQPRVPTPVIRPADSLVDWFDRESERTARRSLSLVDGGDLQVDVARFAQPDLRDLTSSPSLL